MNAVSAIFVIYPLMHQLRLIHEPSRCPLGIVLMHPELAELNSDSKQPHESNPSAHPRWCMSQVGALWALYSCTPVWRS